MKRELIYSEKIIAERIASGLRTAGCSDIKIEERKDWEGKYWVVIY